MVSLTDETLPTQEMFDFFEERTAIHIKRVQKNLQIVSNIYPMLGIQLEKVATEHDKSKYGVNEFIPYVWLTWIKKPGNKNFQYNKDKIDKMTYDAWQSHIKDNPHHPEHHKNVNDMTFINMIEMVCDWEAMSEEMGDDTMEWYNKNVPSRWKFNQNSQEIIKNIILQIKDYKDKKIDGYIG